MLLKSAEQIEIMAEGGQRLARVLRALRDAVRPGITTKSLDELAYKLIKDSGAEPAFLNYRPTGAARAYPATLCASVNDGVVHGIPSAYVIKDGDVVKLDLGLKHRGFYLDSAITVGAGKITREAKKLIDVTRDALELAIREAQPGKTLGDVGYVVQRFVEKNKFSVVRTLTGHGIGRGLHEEPPVFNFGRRGDGDKLVPGMVLAIEPMVAVGSGATRTLRDDSFVTADGSLAAHFEHTVAITEKGPKILTQ